MKKTFNKLIDDNLYNTFIYDSKKQLLDPLSTMTKIIELLFRPVGTKFGINDHSITIDMPSDNNPKYWYNIKNYQSYHRYWYADSRENISKLGIVVVRLIEWYIMPTYELVKNNKKINTKNLEASIQFNSFDVDEVLILWKCLDELTNYFCLALEKLIETYIEGNVVWALQNYINLIIDSKKGKSSEFEQGTFIHPDLAIQLAQWINPHFALQVSSWIRTLFTKGKVNIKLLKEQENKINKSTKKIKILEDMVLKKQKRTEYPESNVIYLLTTEDHKKRRTYIIGKAKNLTTRLGTYNKTCDHEVIYYKECKIEKHMNLSEEIILLMLEE